MARGWESKSVEQQEEAKSKTALRQRLSPQEAAKKQAREILLLSRSRIVQQLERAINPHHREMLEAALKDLDTQLAGHK